MSRYDIADYLAISVETVSRALTKLRHRGAIKLLGTRIVRIVHRDALEEAVEAPTRHRIDEQTTITNYNSQR
jgi:CRP/FNR family nitrogen fixation transcriptional regulator